MGRATTFSSVFEIHQNMTWLSIKDPDGDSTVLGYDGSIRLSMAIDRAGNSTRLVYKSPSSKLDSLVMPAVPINGGASASPAIAYSPWQIVGVPTGLTATTPFTPPATSSVVGVITDPEGHATSFTADHWGQPVTITDPAGHTTYIYENSAGQVIQVNHPLGPVDYYYYDPSGRLTYYGPANVPA